MRLAAAVSLILAATSFAQTQPALVAHTRSGQTITVDRPAAGARSFIVEFREAPRATRTTVERFRRDVVAQALLPAQASQTRVSAPQITNEFTRAFHGVSVVLDDAQASLVRRFAYVKAVYEDAPMRMFADEDTQHLERIGAPKVWTELGSRGKGIDVAVIDTGVDYNHPAFAGRYLGGYDFVDRDDDPMDEHGHGTHVAGIVAGKAEDVIGVAPEARILAIRVLDRYGFGMESTVVAGIERAMDPNNDGDPADRVDIINLSLGGPGHADTPVSLAVDRAVQAGIVVCAAAGNTPGGQTIGSPAAARLAITVGSSEAGDRLAPYSSRGPAMPDFHIKPDVLAPGSLIRSAKRGGGSVIFSGTSMASPHVAGAAALLLALHPDWTPADVKAALTATAKAIDIDVMSQGAGRINAFAAARPPATIAPAVLSLGRNPKAADWEATRTVTITNHSSSAQTYTATATNEEGVVLRVEPASFTLHAGASREVQLTTSVPGAAKPSAVTMSQGGRVSFTSEDGVTIVPFAVVKAAIVEVTMEEQTFHPLVIWSCDGGVATAAFLYAGEAIAVLPHGRCHLLAAADDGINDAAVLIQTHVIADDLDITLDRSQAPNSIRVAGVDADGNQIGKRYSADAPFYSQYAIDLGEDAPYQSFEIFLWSNAPLHISDMPEGSTITAGEVLYDFANRRIVGIQHAPVANVRGDVTVTSLPSDLHHAKIEIAPREQTLRGWTASMHHGGGSFYSSSHGVPLNAGWSGDIWVTKDSSSETIFAPGLHTESYPEIPIDVTSPPIRFVNDRIVFSHDFDPSPVAYGVPEGGTLRLGDPLTSPRSFLQTSGSQLLLSVINVGAAGEVRNALTRLEYELRYPNGEWFQRGKTSYEIYADTRERGPYLLDVKTERMTQLAFAFDTTREDANPPTVTSFRLDGNTLLFSTADYALLEGFGAECRELRSTRASYRVAGGAWQTLPITQVLNDRGKNLGHFETGTLYRASLEGILGAVDVRVEMEDLAGNTTAATMENVRSVSLRRRSVK